MTFFAFERSAGDKGQTLHAISDVIRSIERV